jgi:SAM-dependent methyltransferase
VNTDQVPTRKFKKVDKAQESSPAAAAPPQAPPAPTFVAAAPPASAAAAAAQPPDELSALMQDILSEETGKKDITPDDGTPRVSRDAWYSEVFDELFLRTLPSNTLHRTRIEVDFLARALALEPGRSVLDVACGHGRHALELAERGVDVTGVDLSRVFLERALADAGRRRVEPRLMVGDMRDVDFDSRFDAAFCVGTSFGYFDDRTNFELVTSMFRALKPGGRLAIETVNRDYVVQNVPRRRWWDIQELIVMEEVDFDPRTSRLINKRTVVDAGQRPWEQHISVRLYAAHELCSMLAMAGFRLLSLSGDIAHPGKFFPDLNRSVIVTAQRPE